MKGDENDSPVIPTIEESEDRLGSEIDSAGSMYLDNSELNLKDSIAPLVDPSVVEMAKTEEVSIKYHQPTARSQRGDAAFRFNNPGPVREQDDEDDHIEQDEDETDDEIAYGPDEFPEHAYDLEHGAPIQPSTAQGQVLPWRSKIGSAKEFFATEVLYRFDILETADRNLIRGSCRVELKGYRGGVWTIFIEDEVSVVNRREDAEIVIAMQQRDFLNLINGELNPQLLLLSGKVKINGDLKKALAMQRCLFVPVENDVS